MLMCLGVAAVHAEDRETIDQGRFIVFQGEQPVAIENFEYVRSGDSLVISAVVERKARDASGAELKFDKIAQMVVNGTDYDFRSYLSRQDFDGHNTVKKIAPSDTTLAVTSEVDGAGGIDGMVRPPGRLYVMDPLVFSLFDIICRSVSPQTFTSRPIQLITLGPTSTTTEATITAAGADTVTWGGKRLVARRFEMADAGSRFTVWMDPRGRMLRLEHDGGDLLVMREEPKAAAKPKPPAGKPRSAR